MRAITMIGTLPPVKGISPYTEGLCRELAKHVKIEFIGFRDIYPEFLYSGGTKIPNTKAPKIRNLKNKVLLRWYNPFSWLYAGFTVKGEVVHAQWWSWVLAPVYFAILSIAKLRGKHIIITVHNIEPHEQSFLKKALNASVLWLADEYIVHSNSNRKELQKRTSKTIHVIPHGIIAFPKVKMSRGFLRKKYGYSNDDKIVLFFGAIRPYKGLDLLLTAIGDIDDKKVKLQIAGKPWESFNKYQKIIDKKNLNGRVHLKLGYVPDAAVAELFTVADVAVFPYKTFNAASGAIAAALSFRLPVVATNVAGLEEMNPTVIVNPTAADIKNGVMLALNKNLRSSIPSNMRWSSIAIKTAVVYAQYWFIHNSGGGRHFA